MAYELFTNGAISSTLVSSIGNSDATLTVSSATGFNATGNFRIRLNNEVMLVTAVVGNVFSITRAQDGTTAASHTAGDSVQVVITGGAINQWRADNFQTGHYQSAPAGRDGDLYLCDDAPYLLRYDGSNAAWEAYGPMWRRSAPQLAAFTQHGYAGSYNNTNGHLYGRLPGNSTFNLTAWTIPQPGSTPWTVELGLSWHAERSIDDVSGPAGREWWHLGLCLYDSVSGNLKTWGPGYYDTFGQTSFATTISNAATGLGNSNLYGSNPAVSRCDGGQPFWYLRLAHDSGFLKFYWSRDGFNYWLDHQDAWNDAALPSSTDVGFFASNNHPSQGLHAIFHHWRVF